MILYFLYTIIIEASIIWLIGQAVRMPVRKILAFNFLANCISWPILWFILPLLIKDFRVLIITGEIFVFLFETAFLYAFLRARLNIIEIISICFVTNLVSFGVGLFI